MIQAIVHQRVCLTLADGGKIYMDCNLRKPRAASIKLTFDGILDAKAMKGRIERTMPQTALKKAQILTIIRIGITNPTFHK